MWYVSIDLVLVNGEYISNISVRFFNSHCLIDRVIDEKAMIRMILLCDQFDDLLGHHCSYNTRAWVEFESEHPFHILYYF